MTPSIVQAAAPRNVLDFAERDPVGLRLRRAESDPLFERKVVKAAATLRSMRSAKHKHLAAQLYDALEFAAACGVPLSHVLEDRGLLRTIFG